MLRLIFRKMSTSEKSKLFTSEELEKIFNPDMVKKLKKE
jgi:hypothetical protein